MRTRLHPAADAELIAAAQWYEDLSRGLGGRFIAECIDGFVAIETHPRRFSTVPTRMSREIRRRNLDHFPFAIVYEVRADECVVVAIAHNMRRPNYWRERTG